MSKYKRLKAEYMENKLEIEDYRRRYEDIDRKIDLLKNHQRNLLILAQDCSDKMQAIGEELGELEQKALIENNL